jgi:hypothetical protein
VAIDTLLRFKEDYSPHFTAHLGDFIDTEAWRRGAKGHKDEGKDVDLDVLAGLTFLEQLTPNLVFNGNHEIRVWEALESTKAIEVKAARATVRQLESFIENELRAKYVTSYKVDESWRKMGNTLIGHGFMFGATAIRDHADLAGGNIILGHLHRLGVEQSRSVYGGAGYCVGYLGDPAKFGYAHRNAGLPKWRRGFAYGEYCDNETKITLYHIPCPAKRFQTV